ncbi:MAG: HAMP domain-containing histidine kinase [Labilithrix sp.]|nr:HAMP domain-containing histidine kinase [Labilithrix sp.]
MGDDPAARRERLVAIGEIAAEIAHELRNALQVVSANVFLARQDLAACEPNLAKIERSARLAHAIVDDLMALARGEPAHAEPVPLVDLLLLAREVLPEPGAEFVDAVAPPALHVRAHPGLAARLLHALYDNAIRASAPRRPRVVTKAERVLEPGAARVAIVVADDGPGVAPEIAETLFEPLVTRTAGGTGLGLALARRIVDAHGGSIALVPTAEGGATFRIELPAGEAPSVSRT